MADAVSARSRSVRSTTQTPEQNLTGALEAASEALERLLPERGRQDHCQNILISPYSIRHCGNRRNYTATRSRDIRLPVGTGTSVEGRSTHTSQGTRALRGHAIIVVSAMVSRPTGTYASTSTHTAHPLSHYTQIWAQRAEPRRADAYEPSHSLVPRTATDHRHKEYFLHCHCGYRCPILCLF